MYRHFYLKSLGLVPTLFHFFSNYHKSSLCLCVVTGGQGEKMISVLYRHPGIIQRKSVHGIHVGIKLLLGVCINKLIIFKGNLIRIVYTGLKSIDNLVGSLS